LKQILARLVELTEARKKDVPRAITLVLAPVLLVTPTAWSCRFGCLEHVDGHALSKVRMWMTTL
jgi:hypothetical protein